MRDFSDDLAELRRRVEGARGYLQHRRRARPGSRSSRSRSASPTSGTTRTRARKVNTELVAASRTTSTLVDELDGTVSDLETLSELGREESDDSVEQEIDAGLDALGRRARPARAARAVHRRARRARRDLRP